MSKIGDLFVRLGLKKDDFSKGIKDAQKQTETFAGKLKSLSTVAKTAWAAVAAAVVKFAKDSISMTQKWGDEWRNTMSGVNAAYGSFVRQLSSGEGWNNLFANMREAYRVGKEVAAALDEIFERRTSYSYTEAVTNNEIEALRAIMQDRSKSDAERKQAAQDIIDKTNELGKLQKDIAEQEADALRKQFSLQTGMNEDEINYLVREYNQNRKTIEDSRNYLAERARLQKAIKAAENSYGTGAMSAKAYEAIGKRVNDAKAALQQLDATTSQTVKDVAEMTKKYDKSNDELVAGLSKAETAVINVDTQVMMAQRRANSMLGQLNASAATSSGEDPGAAQAAKILKRAEDSAKSEIQLLFEKYQAEKALLEQYGLETTSLTEEYFRNINKIIGNSLDESLQLIEDVEPVELDLIDMSDVDAEIDAFIQHILDETERAKEIAQEFGNAVAGGFSDACQELMDQLLGLEEANPGAVIKALLDPLASMAVKAGEIIMAEGIAVEAAKAALASFGGVGAIVAGAALIAAGTAAKAGLSALANGGKTTATTAGSYSGGSSSTRTENVETEMTITVQGRLSGSDIVLAGQKTMNNWSR